MYSSQKVVEDSAKVCCTSGQPSAGSYSGHGHVIQLPKSGERAYVSSTPNVDKSIIKRGVIIIYDIFGLDIGNTRAFVDHLVELENAEMVAIMPDMFHGKPWSLDQFPPKDPGQFRSWINSAGSWEVVQPMVEESITYLRQEFPNLRNRFGALGFCWGGHQALTCCTRDDFSAGVSIHGAFISSELVEQTKAPIMFLHTTEDPGLEPFKEILDKKPFGKECFYHVYKQQHGFAAARGDWSKPEVKHDVDDALKHAKEHLLKHV